MDEIDFFPTHQKRISIEFSNYLTLSKELTIRLQKNENDRTSQNMRIFSIENYIENCFHAAVIIRRPEAWFHNILNEIVQQVVVLRNNTSIETRNMILNDSLHSIAFAVFSQHLYIYTDQVSQELEESVHTSSQTLGLKVLWRDDAYWARGVALQNGELFLCHDSRDKPFVESFSNELIINGISPWFDKISLRLGDNIIEKINEGLKHCRYAVLVLSPTFLKNYAWPRREFTILTHLSLQAHRMQTDNNKKLLPIWLGVTSDDVMKYDPALVDIFAARLSYADSIKPEEVRMIARQILQAIRG